jgi:23S rRNA (uracil1939-C5)-methyltransferase
MQVQIQALGQRGEGIAEINGQRVYVPFTLPGEMAEIDVEGERGTLIELLAPSESRAEPFCPHFGICGGCQLQHLDPPSYAAFKRGLVETALSHANIDVPVGDLVDARGQGRRRATMHASKAGAGYMSLRSHHIHDIELCPILVPALAKAPLIARAVHASLGDCDVSFTATATGIDVAVKAEKKIRPEKLAPIVQRFALARLTLNGETVLQGQVPMIKMGKAAVELPPGSFLQATARAEEALSELVLAGVKGAKSVVDLFCGMGPFALRVAEKAKVYATDADKPAIATLIKAWRGVQGLKVVTAERRDLFREPMTQFELNTYDAAIIDPPRAGAEAQTRELAKSKIKTVVSVSCEPKTFARDAAILIEAGFKLESVTPVDQFAYSTHVEVVGVFRR